MSDPVKFTQEELDKITNIQKDYARIRDEFGGICLAKINLRNQIDQMDEAEVKLSEELKGVQDGEKSFLDEITKKYGEGQLDPKTGLFTKK